MRGGIGSGRWKGNQILISKIDDLSPLQMPQGIHIPPESSSGLNYVFLKTWPAMKEIESS